MMQRLLPLSALVAAMIATAVPAAAQTAPPAGAAVNYVSGGIGNPDLARMRSLEDQFNTQLVFTLIEGNFVAGVGVTITDGKGQTVVKTVSDGPIFLAQLPAGVYTVTAVYEGVTVTRRLTVPASGRRTHHLRWASDPAIVTPAPRR